MLVRRELSSSKFYPEVPCVIAKSLVAKYQRNKRSRVVRNLVPPLCGDKGKQIKLEGNGIRILALFRKGCSLLCGCVPPSGSSAVLSFSEEAESGLHLSATTFKKNHHSIQQATLE